MKSVIASLLCMAALSASADTLAPASASGVAAPPKADDYIECATLYDMYSQMQGNTAPVNLKTLVGLATVMGVVTSSDSYVKAQRVTTFNTEMKRLETARKANAEATYMESFRLRVSDCADTLNQGNVLLHDKIKAYLDSHHAAAPAASGG